MNVGKGKNVFDFLPPAAGHETPPFVSLQVEAGDLYGHAEHSRSNRDAHLVLEDLEESRHLFAGVMASTVISSMSWARDCAMARAS